MSCRRGPPTKKPINYLSHNSVFVEKANIAICAISITIYMYIVLDAFTNEESARFLKRGNHLYNVPYHLYNVPYHLYNVPYHLYNVPISSFF
jgi:hypothetical protein